MTYRYPPVSNLPKLLEALREVPATTEAAKDDVLAAIYNHLMNTHSNPPGNIHWFCKKADSLTKEAAAFLLRLFAYDSDGVTKWKNALHDCVSHCTFCAQTLELGKIVWSSTYFGAFESEVLTQFFTQFDGWELQKIVQDINLAETASNSSSNEPTASLPSGTLYRMVSNWNIFCDSRVTSYLQTHVPPSPVSCWPEHPLPPGMLVLLIVDDANLRNWAKGCASGSKVIPNDLLSRSYIEALELIISALETSSHSVSEQDASLNPAMPAPLNLRLAQRSDLWFGVYTIIRLLPPEWLNSNSGNPLNLRRITLSHLRDPAPHFQDVFKCFIFLMKRLGKDLWVGEGPEYPQTTFDAIKHNSHYVNLLHTTQTSESSGNLFVWFPEYLSTLRHTKLYPNIFAKVVDFLSSETQHGLDQNKLTILKVMITMLYTEFTRLRDDNNVARRAAFDDVLDAHADTIISVAYGKQNDGDDWKKAQGRARAVVEWALEANIACIKTTLNNLCEVLVRHNQDIKTPFPTFTGREKMWKALYSTLQSLSTSKTQDSKSLARIIHIVSQISHIAKIPIQTFSNGWNSKEGDKILKNLNDNLFVIQSGLSSAISAFSDYGAPTKVLEVLQYEEVGRSMTLLLLSPVEDLQNAAKAFIGLAFDADGGRAECFRRLFENLPSETFMGIFQFLKTFSRYADTMPEASTLSAMLVLCFADILDVLCTSPDGLLHNSHFLKMDSDDGPASRILQFWKLLTQALSLIYKRTPMWAIHVDIPGMVGWMRDALILARDVLKQWRVIEYAANAYTKAPTKATKHDELSVVGKQMIGSLQEFLPQLVKWLRLTDEELLHQSFALLFSVFDLMKETHIPPAQTAIEKLSKYVESVKKVGATGSVEQKTRLDPGRILELSRVLVSLQDKVDEHEVEIVSHTLPPTKKPTIEAPKKNDAPAHRPYIQGKTTLQVKAQPRLSFSTSSTVSSRIGSAKFTEKDQQILDAAVPHPSFRKPQSTASVSTKASATQPPHDKTVSKNESLSRSTAASEESESDESESDEDDPDAPTLDDLAKIPSPKKPKKSKLSLPTVKQPAERRQIKVLEIPTNIRLQNERIERDKQRNAALRMKPDISGLHKILLSWNYNHGGTTPPGPPLQPTLVPDRFHDYNNYFNVFQPLLLMECWAQISQTKEERRDSYQCKVESRQYVDSWLDLELVISETVKRDWYLAETDVVLIRHASLDKCIMAKVKQYRALMSGIQMTVRCVIQGGTGDPGLQIGTLWQLSKLFSLSTLHREYAALMSLQYNEICRFIMQPRLQKSSEVDPRDLQETIQTYRVNEPQAIAILQAMKTNGFTLIQGPPGTGKTSTICGLIARFLAKRPRPTVKIIPGQANGHGSTLRKTHKAEDTGPVARVLVCAPSNAAIDEVAQRIRDGRIGSDKKSNILNIVRIGPEQTLSAGVRDISLDYLVDQKLDNTPKPFNDISNEIKSIRDEIETVKSNWKAKREEMDKCASNSARFMTLENEVKTLNARKHTLINKLDSKKDQQKSDSRTFDTLRRNTRNQILLQADIICSTLAGAGHESLEGLEFDMIIIDEAAQAIELSSLIPLKYGCSHCIMVGDPQQLPPTVISQEATNYGYNQSLFVRLQRSHPDAVHLLSIQYRMHPDISRLPSKVFYDGRLLDGPEMATKTRQLWHTHNKFGTYKFLNVSWGIEEKVGLSVSNPAECKIAADLFNRLRGDFSNITFDFRIGIVSMYKAQINALRNLFIQRFGNDIIKKVTFNTVDGFQGQEKDIIILSCVRAGPGLQKIGFTADIRRMNVALTRAKSSLFILGNAATLERSDDTWRAIVQDARSRESLVAIDPAYFAQAVPRPIISTTEPLRKKRKIEPMEADPTTPALLTPQEFKTTVQTAASTSASTLRGTKRLANNDDPPLNRIKNSEEVPTPNTAQPSASTPTLSTGPVNPPPRKLGQPPRKRPKQQTMFIPSKKRPM